MGTGEESSPAKPSKTTPSTTQEVPTTPVYPEWPGSVQVYYGAGATPPFYPSGVASPHPYMYHQHPFVPHYGTPVPYPAMYPPGSVYPHPSLAMTPTSVAPSVDMEGKDANGKEQTSAKKSKSKGTSVNKTGESAKSASGNDTGSHSGGSGSDGSSYASDEEEHARKKGSFNQMLADANAHNSATPNAHGAVPIVSVPGTNLNIGMELWNASPAAASAKMRSNPSGGSSAIVPGSMPEPWRQDEREMKRQKRKQSNRESARRSRLRKQAECEELQQRVQNLTSDNDILKSELMKLSEECEKLKAENESIKKKLKESHGAEAAEPLEENKET